MGKAGKKTKGKKRTAVKDLTAKDAKAVKGGMITRNKIAE